MASCAALTNGQWKGRDTANRYILVIKLLRHDLALLIVIASL
jgi:hypothetical protein